MKAQVVEALKDSLRLAPDPGDVFTGVLTGVERRRRRQRHYRTGAVVAAAALALVAGVVTADSIRDGHGDRNVAAADQIPVGEWPSTLRLGWVPEGLQPPIVTATQFAEGILYPGTIGSPLVSYLRVSLVAADEPPKLDQPGWQRTEINGRPASEISEPTRTIVAFQLQGGRWVEVEFGRGVPTPGVPGGPDGQPGHRDTALRIARSVEQTGDTRLRTGFAPTYLPAGQRVFGVMTETNPPSGYGTVYTTGTGGSPKSKAEAYSFSGGAPGQPGPGVSISVESDDRPALFDPPGRRIADIQGLPAYRQNGGDMVMVRGFHGGVLTVTATVRRLTANDESEDLATIAEQELVKIAEGVRWVG